MRMLKIDLCGHFEKVDVTFEEAAFGIKKKLNITKMEKCSACNGSGAKPGS